MSILRKILRSALIISTLGYGLSSTHAGELTIYAGAEADNIKYFSEVFAKSHPDIKLNWIRDSTGIIAARVLAEKDNPKADILFAMAVTSMTNFAKQGFFEPYSPKGIDKLNPLFLDGKTPAEWVGLYGWASAMCFNTIEADKLKLPRPTKWSDLVNPIYKGRITMPNPASAGTGYLMVAAWIQMMGEAKAWEFMDQLHQNIGSYSHSGSKPCEQAAAGEYVIGLSFPFRAIKLKEQGAPIDIILADEGTGWEMQTAAIMKGTKNLTDAKIFMDWALTNDAMKAYASRYEVTATPVDIQKSKFFPADLDKKLIKNDFAWAAAEQPRIIAEWRKRYDGKSEPKK